MSADQPSTRISTIEAWHELTKNRSGWFWLVGSLRNGDIYHICSLAASFAQHYGRTDPIYLVVSKQSQSNAASLFREDFAEIVISNNLPGSVEEWDLFFEKTGLPRFGQNTPILPHPNFYVWGRAAIEMAAQTHRTWMDIYKKILRIPGDCEPSFPSIDENVREEAQRFCLSSNMRPGRSVILFPYAQSLPMPALAAFAKLARDLHLEGWSVYTSTADQEEPVVGTLGLHIPFHLLIEVAEYCGWVVAIRSGICDITSSARCRRTFIYPSFETLVAWSVHAMDLARDAHEISYPFTGPPGHFSALVRSGTDTSPLAAPPRRLSPLLGLTGVKILSISFFECLDHDVSRLCRDIKDGSLAALVVYDVPCRNHPRLRERARILAELLRSSEDTSIYACRETSPSSMFERVGYNNFLSGQYIAADYWHSLAVLPIEDGRRLTDLLPLYTHDSLLSVSQTIVPNVVVLIGEHHGSAEHVSATSQARPLSVGGLQFVEGWCDLEAWGLWSNGLRPKIKLAATQPLAPDTTLHVEVNACVSPAFPQIRANVLLNGALAARLAITSSFHNRFELPLGAICAGENDVTIVFELDEVRSPLDQGGGVDSRKLGLGLVAVELRDTPRFSASSA